MRRLSQFLRRLQSGFVVRLEVVAIRTVEHVNVPQGRMIALIDDLQRLVVSGRNECSAGFALMKKFFLSHLTGFGMMRDEDDLDILITGAQELIQQKEEGSGEILPHGIAGAGRVNDAEHDGVGFVARIRDGVMIAQIVHVKRETVRHWVADMMLDLRLFSLDPRARRALFVQTHTNPFAAKPLMTELSL